MNNLSSSNTVKYERKGANVIIQSPLVKASGGCDSCAYPTQKPGPNVIDGKPTGNCVVMAGTPGNWKTNLDYGSSGSLTAGRVLYRSQFDLDLACIFIDPFLPICIEDSSGFRNYFINVCTDPGNVQSETAYTQYLYFTRTPSKIVDQTKIPKYLTEYRFIENPQTNPQFSQNMYTERDQTTCKDQGYQAVYRKDDGNIVDKGCVFVGFGCYCDNVLWFKNWNKIHIGCCSLPSLSSYIQSQTDWKIPFTYNPPATLSFKYQNLFSLYRNMSKKLIPGPEGKQIYVPDYDYCNKPKYANSVNLCSVNNELGSDKPYCLNCAVGSPNTCNDCDLNIKCAAGCITYNVCNMVSDYLSASEISTRSACLDSDWVGTIFNQYCFLPVGVDDRYFKACLQIDDFYSTLDGITYIEGEKDRQTFIDNQKKTFVWYGIENFKPGANWQQSQAGIFKFLPALWETTDYQKLDELIKGQYTDKNNVETRLHNNGKVAFFDKDGKEFKNINPYVTSKSIVHGMQYVNISWPGDDVIEKFDGVYNWLSRQRRFVLRREKIPNPQKPGENMIIYRLYFTVYNSDMYNYHYGKNKDSSSMNIAKDYYKNQYTDFIENSENTYKNPSLADDVTNLPGKIQPYMCMYPRDMAKAYGFTDEDLEKYPKLQTGLACIQPHCTSNYIGITNYPQYYLENFPGPNADNKICPQKLCLIDLKGGSFNISDDAKIIINNNCGDDVPFPDVKKSTCKNNKCQNGSRCVSSEDGYQCVCKPGYTGEFCENTPDKCKGFNCPANSICEVDDNGNPTCTCTDGYTGENCEIPPGGSQNQMILWFLVGLGVLLLLGAIAAALESE